MPDKIKTRICRSCGADIVWMKTVNGKSIPVDAETVHDSGAELFDSNFHVSHFATCPDADKFRKKKEEGKGGSN